MINKSLYKYLGKCIQKIRHKQYKQEELSADICSKFTLSRIENGNIPSNVEIIEKLIERLGYHCKDVVDLLIVSALIKHLVAAIEYNNTHDIISDIKKMEALMLRNENNILFLDYKILCNYLRTHYIDRSLIEIKQYDLNTLDYHCDAFYTLTVSLISENLLFHCHLQKFLRFFDSLSKKEGNIILDFFHMLSLQYNGQTLKVNDIFNYHKEALNKDMKTYQLLRYRSVLAIGFVEYEPTKAMRHFDKIALVHSKNNVSNYYFYIAAAGQATIHINNKDYDLAYHCLHNCIERYPPLISYSVPYIIFLSFRTENKLEGKYLKYGYNKLCDTCIDYYHFRSANQTGTAHVRYMTRIFPRLIKHFRINDPFIKILRKEELYQVDRSHCYKTGSNFYKKLKDNCKEVSTL